jgi:hypothetical protein
MDGSMYMPLFQRLAYQYWNILAYLTMWAEALGGDKDEVLIGLFIYLSGI